jgi:hypothetical protein
MELHYQSSDTLSMSTYVNGSLTDVDQVLGVYKMFVTITRLSDSTVIVNNATATRISTGRYAYTLSTADNSYLGKYKAVWTYTISSVVNTKTDYYEVVVPYTSAQELRDMYPDLATKSNAEIYRKEQIARRIINVYCNQSFDFENAVTKIIYGKDAPHLFLPRRLFTLTSVKIDNTDDVTTDLEVYDDYWLKPTWVTNMKFVDIKRGITEPSYYFWEQYKYYVKGNWGWEDVPENIHLAAMILVNDYFCDDTLLREHGVISSTMGDRSIDFKRDLWGTTGNYNVDMLLSDYTYFNMRLI